MGAEPVVVLYTSISVLNWMRAATGSQCKETNGAFPLHGMARYGTVQYGSLLGGFPLGTVPGTRYFFSQKCIDNSQKILQEYLTISVPHARSTPA